MTKKYLFFITIILYISSNKIFSIEITDTVKIIPILEYVKDNGDGSYTAHWGYYCENDLIVDSLNSYYLTKPIDNTNPPSKNFYPGRHFDVFTSTFTSNTFTWYIQSTDGVVRSATASIKQAIK